MTILYRKTPRTLRSARSEPVAIADTLGFFSRPGKGRHLSMAKQLDDRLRREMRVMTAVRRPFVDRLLNQFDLVIETYRQRPGYYPELDQQYGFAKFSLSRRIPTVGVALQNCYQQVYFAIGRRLSNAGLNQAEATMWRQWEARRPQKEDEL